MAKRVRRSNVKDGVLLPLGNGFSLVKGDHPNKVDDVDIGPNNKNGLSVNHGEILQQKGNTLRVFSAEPMLGGVSPTQLLYGGMAPDKVFAMQEQYKRVNRIADDGTRYKKGGQTQTPVKEIDWSGIKTANNRPYNVDYIDYINKKLIAAGYNNNKRASILANIIEESGGDPFAEGPGGYYGLLQWGSNRYTKTDEKDVYKEIDNQLEYLNNTIGETKDQKSWTHGGDGSGYNSFTDAMAAFDSDDLNKSVHGFTWGYIRPKGKQDSYLNRQKVADQLINLEGFKFGGRKRFQTGGEDDVLMRIDSEGNLIDSIQPSVVTAKLPAKFNGSQVTAARYAEGYKFGKKIAQQRDNVTKQVVDKLLPTNLNKDLDDNALGYTPIVGDILQGVQGVKDFNKGNYLKGTVGLGLLVVPNILEKPVKAAIKYGSYKIKDLSGYMLKSLMRNNPLEKQLSKTGTINVDNVKTLINKGSDVEKSVVDKVLTSEQFAGKKAIDYNDFRKAVQDELIIYKRTPSDLYKKYGADRIGALSTNEILYDTYTFSSPRIPIGSSKHYDANTLGHSRTYTTAYEPDVLHVMESQSDWAQQGVALDRSKKIAKANERYPGGFEARRDKAIGNAKKDVETWKKIIETGVAGDGRKLEAWEIENIRTDLLYNAERKLRELKAAYSYVDPQELYLSDNYISRQIQENLRYAAEKGQTKMRYPTRETAAKIEGYPEREAYFDAQGNDITTSGQSIYTFGEKLDKELKNINNELKKLREYDYRPDVKDKMAELFERKDNILKGESKLRPGITKKTVYDYEDILKKYTKFPDQYRKLYKNADVRIVSDKMGNTWYEVDVPKDYLNQEWKFKFGGQTNINTLGERPNAKYGKEMKNKRKKSPLTEFVEAFKYLPSRSDLNSAFDATKNLIEGDKFKGGDFGGAGASVGFYGKDGNNPYDYVRNTPILSNRTFSEAYTNARKQGLSSFMFNGKKYNTDYDPNAKLGNRIVEQTPVLNLREVLDENEKVITDSTRVEPWVGQLPGMYKRDKYKFGGKRNKALTGITISPYKDRFGNNIDLLKGTVDRDNSNINLLTGEVNHKITNPNNIKLLTGDISKNAINPVGDLTKSSGLSTTAMSAIGAGINTLGSLIGAGIQQYAINNLKAPQRQYTLLSPVKLKTKININPQIARMREMQAQIADAARRTSGSSRTAYQKILAGHNRLLDSAMDLYGRKENIETELINRDRLNQQRVAQANATNVMNTINYNNEAATEMRNRKQVATSNNWTNTLNTAAGAWAGPNGFIDRANALRVKAGELYTQAIANPTAARLLYGDINFVTDADKRKAFNTIYDFLNNNRFA